MDKREVIKLLSTYHIINKSVFFCILYDRLTRVAKSAMFSFVSHFAHLKYYFPIQKCSNIFLNTMSFVTSPAMSFK